jgi:hypothetical protein
MRTRRPRNGIEIMVDRATGAPIGDGTVPVMVVVRCPKCNWRDRMPAEEAYPDATRIIEITCPNCNGGEFGEPRFLDAAGKEIS